MRSMPFRYPIALVAALFSIAAAGADPVFSNFRLSCLSQVRKANAPPRITLVGEIHNDPRSNLIRNQLYQQASDGHHLLMVEPLPDDRRHTFEEMLAADLQQAGVKRKPETRIFGLENNFSYTIGGLVMLRLNVAGADEEASRPSRNPAFLRKRLDYLEAFTGMVIHQLLSERPYIEGALSAYENNSGTQARDRALAALLRDFLGRDRSAHPMTIDRVTALVREALGDHWASEGDSRKAMLRFLANIVRDGVHTAAGAKKAEELPPPQLVDRFEALLAKDDWNKIDALLSVEWRDRAMARNIAIRYCQALEENKPLDVALGEAHVPGVTAHLHEIFKDSGVRVEQMFTALPDGPGSPRSH